MELLDPEIEAPLKRRRGPKPLSLRAKFAATSWLDGEVLWREGRVAWRLDGRELAIGPRELEATSRALSSLGRHDRAARRERADFDQWHACRLEQFKKANLLATIRAPDLEALVSPSRRRNPAALDRLTALLAVEISVAEPLPHSPARALFEAWPLSACPLKQWLQSENQPLEARALAALIVGAAMPLEALPGEPWLRRAARYGARFGFPRAPQLVVSLLQNGGRDGEISVRRVEETLENPAPFGFDAAALLTLQRAGHDASTLASLAECVRDWPDPFLPLSFAPVLPKRFDLEAQRAVSANWHRLRSASVGALRATLARIARSGDPRDLERISQLLNALISSPIRALGPLKIEKNRKSRRCEDDLPAFEKGVEKAVAVAVGVLETIAVSPDPSGILALLTEALPQCEPCSGAEGLSPANWAAGWHSHLATQQQRFFGPLLKLAQRGGVSIAREALRLGCWRELARERGMESQFWPLALEIVAWAPASANDIPYRLARWARHWKVAEAQAAFAPILAALGDLAPDERALWLEDIASEVEDSRRGVRAELPALAAFAPAMLRAARRSAAMPQPGPLQPDVAGAVEAGAELSKRENLPRWAQVEVALALMRSAPGAQKAGLEAQSLARFEWLAGEMVERWSAAEKEPSWSNIGDLVTLCAQLAGENEPQFVALMTANWRFAGYSNGFEWCDVRRGARLARRFPALQSAIRDNLTRCPARCFKVLEILGPLDRFEALRTHLEAPPPAIEASFAASFASNWQPIFDLDADLEPWARRLALAKSGTPEAQNPPPALLKIAGWPQKIAGEIAALRGRDELTPHLQTRLENLTARLGDAAGLRAAMRRELGEALQNATFEAELCAAERAVEGCYRARLETLGVPKTAELDADLLNAALFSTDIESNRKWLREIVRAHCENRPDWRLEIEGNARFLRSLDERGLSREQWLFEAPRRYEIGKNRFEIRLESNPLQILQMGNYFDTCLSRGGINAHSSVANAVELNKRVVFARDAKGRVVGRQLLALSKAGKLLGFHVYTSIDEAHTAELRAAFGEYARDFAARCGVELADTGEVERLFVSDWYDDGTISWDDLAPDGDKLTANKICLKEEKMKTKKSGAPVLTGRDAHIARLQAGETVSFREGGNSMTPRIKSRQKCTYQPVNSLDDIRVGDAVFCRVGSSYFTHLVSAIQGERVQISNNHGHVNGWTNLAHIYGKVVKIEN